MKVTYVTVEDINSGLFETQVANLIKTMLSGSDKSLSIQLIVINYPWRFSFNSLNNLLMLKNFKLIHSNDYKHNENMVMIFENRKLLKKKYKFDNYKKIITFFKKWKKYSNFF